MIEKQVENLAQKIPSFEEFRKNKNSSWGYLFYICFFLYFIYKEFVQKDDCGQRIATLEAVMKDKDRTIQLQGERIRALEVAWDVRNGVIQRVEDVTDSLNRRKHETTGVY